MSEQQHIVSSYDTDLEAIQAMIMKMGGLTEAAILQAANSLETRDEELAEKVRRNDKAIDALEEQINEETAGFIKMLREVYQDFGFDSFRIKFSDRPDNRAGSDETWDKAEGALREASIWTELWSVG